jgi:hypothetical protein
MVKTGSNLNADGVKASGGSELTEAPQSPLNDEKKNEPNRERTALKQSMASFLERSRMPFQEDKSSFSLMTPLVAYSKELREKADFYKNHAEKAFKLEREQNESKTSLLNHLIAVRGGFDEAKQSFQTKVKAPTENLLMTHVDVRSATENSHDDHAPQPDRLPNDSDGNAVLLAVDGETGRPSTQHLTPDSIAIEDAEIKGLVLEMESELGTWQIEGNTLLKRAETLLEADKALETLKARHIVDSLTTLKSFDDLKKTVEDIIRSPTDCFLKDASASESLSKSSDALRLLKLKPAIPKARPGFLASSVGAENEGDPDITPPIAAVQESAALAKQEASANEQVVAKATPLIGMPSRRHVSGRDNDSCISEDDNGDPGLGMTATDWEEPEASLSDPGDADNANSPLTHDNLEQFNAQAFPHTSPRPRSPLAENKAENVNGQRVAAELNNLSSELGTVASGIAASLNILEDRRQSGTVARQEATQFANTMFVHANLQGEHPEYDQSDKDQKLITAAIGLESSAEDIAVDIEHAHEDCENQQEVLDQVRKAAIIVNTAAEKFITPEQLIAAESEAAAERAINRHNAHNPSASLSLFQIQAFQEDRLLLSANAADTLVNNNDKLALEPELGLDSKKLPKRQTANELEAKPAMLDVVAKLGIEIVKNAADSKISFIASILQHLSGVHNSNDICRQAQLLLGDDTNKDLHSREANYLLKEFEDEQKKESSPPLSDPETEKALVDFVESRKGAFKAHILCFDSTTGGFNKIFADNNVAGPHIAVLKLENTYSPLVKKTSGVEIVDPAPKPSLRKKAFSRLRHSKKSVPELANRPAPSAIAPVEVPRPHIIATDAQIIAVKTAFDNVQAQIEQIKSALKEVDPDTSPDYTRKKLEDEKTALKTIEAQVNESFYHFEQSIRTGKTSELRRALLVSEKLVETVKQNKEPLADGIRRSHDQLQVVANHSRSAEKEDHDKRIVQIRDVLKHENVKRYLALFGMNEEAIAAYDHFEKAFKENEEKMLHLFQENITLDSSGTTLEEIFIRKLGYWESQCEQPEDDLANQTGAGNKVGIIQRLENLVVRADKQNKEFKSEIEAILDDPEKQRNLVIFGALSDRNTILKGLLKSRAFSDELTSEEFEKAKSEFAKCDTFSTVFSDANQVVEQWTHDYLKLDQVAVSPSSVASSGATAVAAKSDRTPSSGTRETTTVSTGAKPDIAPVLLAV